MATFLVLDYGSPQGYREMEGPLPDTIDVGGGTREKAMWVWSEEYYDIVALGGTHWRFRQVPGSLPPTLKKK